MSARLGYPGTAVAGEVLSVGKLNRMAGGWLGYVLVTTNQGSITALVDLTGATVTVTVPTKRMLRITVTVHLGTGTGGGNWNVRLSESVTGISLGEPQQIVWITETSGQSVTATMTTLRVIDDAGADPGEIVAEKEITYKLRARNLGTGTVTSVASATAPLMLLVEDVGPAPA